MADVIRWLLFPGIVLLAWLISRHNDDFARKSTRLAPVVLAILLACLALTGWFRPDERAALVHKWTGHGAMIATWLCVPYAMGVALQQRVWRRPFIALAYVLVLLLALGSCFVASFTGYLGPSSVENLDRETARRFTVLHEMALPAWFAMLLACWFGLANYRKPDDQGRAIGDNTPTSAKY